MTALIEVASKPKGGCVTNIIVGEGAAWRGVGKLKMVPTMNRQAMSASFVFLIEKRGRVTREFWGKSLMTVLYLHTVGEWFSY